MIKRISPDNLMVGMYIAGAQNASWIPRNNQSRAGLIKRQETIDKICRLGIETVYIDTDKGLDSPWAEVPDLQADALLRQQEQSGVASPSVPLQLERQQAERIHAEALGVVENIMDRVKAGADIELHVVEGMADQIVDSIVRNENGFACLTRIREKDAYLMEHSLNVGVLLALLGKYLGFSRPVVRQLAVGGMLHDIGKINVPDEVLNKPGKLTGEEWEEMKRHVQYGHDYLRELGGVDPIVLSICRQHHERIDGSGYPQALNASQIDEYGRMAAVCDVYDAITADRVYHDGMAPDVAMKRLVEWSDEHLDKTLVYEFIRCMSIYPVGTAVELASGRLGVVIEPNRIKQSQPIVRVMYHLKHLRFEPVQALDLANGRETDSIVRALDPSALPPEIQLMDFI